VIKESGADILRLWVSMSDYREEIRVSKEILARVVEAYQEDPQYVPVSAGQPVRLRPGARPASRLAPARSGPLRACPLCRTRARDDARLSGVRFPTIFQTINDFVTTDLSAFYLDVSKDRLYTFRADSVERRSAQTAQYVLADGLCRIIAPILSMTADEIWRQLPGPRRSLGPPR
jgi:isoleucyl-tRNA synthetase